MAHGTVGDVLETVVEAGSSHYFQKPPIHMAKNGKNLAKSRFTPRRQCQNRLTDFVPPSTDTEDQPRNSRKAAGKGRQRAPSNTPPGKKNRRTSSGKDSIANRNHDHEDYDDENSPHKASLTRRAPVARDYDDNQEHLSDMDSSDSGDEQDELDQRENLKDDENYQETNRAPDLQDTMELVVDAIDRVNEAINLVPHPATQVTQPGLNVPQAVPNVTQPGLNVSQPNGHAGKKKGKKDTNKVHDNWSKEINAAMKIVFRTHKFTPSDIQEEEYGREIMKHLNIAPDNRERFASEHSKKWMQYLCAHRNYVQVSFISAYFFHYTPISLATCMLNSLVTSFLGRNKKGLFEAFGGKTGNRAARSRDFRTNIDQRHPKF